MVRYVGDEVAIVAGENEDCVDKALKLIKVDYEIKEPVLDFRKALDNPIKVHEEDNLEHFVMWERIKNVIFVPMVKVYMEMLKMS